MDCPSGWSPKSKGLHDERAELTYVGLRYKTKYTREYQRRGWKITGTHRHRILFGLRDENSTVQEVLEGYSDLDRSTTACQSEAYRSGLDALYRAEAERTVLPWSTSFVATVNRYIMVVTITMYHDTKQCLGKRC